MKYILLITILVFQLNVTHAQSIYDTYAQQAAPEFDSTAEFFNVVTHQFVLINDARHKQKNFMQLVEATETIPGIINKWKHVIMSVKDTLDFNTLSIIKSEDKNFCIVSWDTRLGDTKIDYASIILYKVEDSIFIEENKQEFIKGTPENPKIRYTAIYTLNSKNKKIYLAKGYGQGKTTEPWQEIKTFCIENNSLSNPNVLPNKKNRLLVAINSNELKGIKKTPPLSFNNSSLILTIPVTNKSNIFQGSYISYRFNETRFKEIKDMNIRYAMVPY